VILLDTNVVSALMQREPDPKVVACRRHLEDAFAQALAEDFEGRVLPFDQPAAQAAGRIAAERRRAGRPVEIRDVQVAGIAVARKAALATRNRRRFEGLGLALVDPWLG
jgi:predicted nucleic acid-binding protein